MTRGRVAPLALLVATLVLAGCGHSVDGSAAQHASPRGHSAAGPTAPRPRCPLTGERVGKGENVHGTALAVKIDNIAPALPQAGIDHADVVVEELVEGGLTRLMAIFQCSGAATVGPIRSARISDADVLALLHGSVLAFSGANPADLPPIVAHSDAALISQDTSPQSFHLDTSRAAPHDVFSATRTLIAAGRARRKGLSPPKPLFSYGALDGSATPVSRVSMSWPAASASWSSSHGTWLRTQDGVADRVVGGRQVQAANVVILSVPIESTGLHDVLGSASPRDVTVGSGTAWVLRDGHLVKGSWHRTAVTSGLTLRDTHGRVLRLQRGRTWVELLPNTAAAPLFTR